MPFKDLTGQPFGETHTLSEWSELKGLKYGALCRRIRANWPIEKALTTPVKGK